MYATQWAPKSNFVLGWLHDTPSLRSIHRKDLSLNFLSVETDEKKKKKKKTPLFEGEKKSFTKDEMHKVM